VPIINQVLAVFLKRFRKILPVKILSGATHKFFTRNWFSKKIKKFWERFKKKPKLGL
jgi:hypothetical protein